MNRFVKTLSVLIISLFCLSAGINATLDHLAASPSRSRLALYGHDGRLLVVYTGDVRQLAQADRPAQESELPPRGAL